jgi:high-affinity nickel permease
MSLIDSTDSVLMLGAYGWAFVKPVRKLYYNITITSVSVLVALATLGTLDLDSNPGSASPGAGRYSRIP